MSGKPTPPEKRCRAMVAGQKERGAYWSPPHRCLNYAKPNGYCPRHQPNGRPDDGVAEEREREAELP